MNGAHRGRRGAASPIDRRSFVGALGAAAVTLGARIAPEDRRQTPLRLWTWVHGGSDRTPAEWRARFTELRRAGFVGVLVSGGDTAVLSWAARASGLEFHRWLWILNRNGDAWVREHHPEWFTVSRNGESTLEAPPYVDYYRWVCPSRAEVRAYLAEMIDGVAADPAVDGVHLDYIRHSDVILPVGLWSRYGLVQDREYPEFDFCYCDECRRQFRERSGADPLELPDPPSDEAWRRFRWDSVTRLVRELARVSRGRAKPISAAVFPTPTIARRLVRQAWDEWGLDRVFPMLYHGFYEQDVPWIGTSVEEGVRALGGTPLYAGLYLPDLDPAAAALAVRTARAAGAAGVSFFESAGLTDEHLAAIAGG